MEFPLEDLVVFKLDLTRQLRRNEIQKMLILNAKFVGSMSYFVHCCVLQKMCLDFFSNLLTEYIYLHKLCVPASCLYTIFSPAALIV